jgi:hypothetical protein
MYPNLNRIIAGKHVPATQEWANKEKRRNKTDNK